MSGVVKYVLILPAKCPFRTRNRFVKFLFLLLHIKFLHGSIIDWINIQNIVQLKWGGSQSAYIADIAFSQTNKTKSLDRESLYGDVSNYQYSNWNSKMLDKVQCKNNTVI